MSLLSRRKTRWKALLPVVVLLIAGTGGCEGSQETASDKTLPATLAEYIDGIVPQLDPETVDAEQFIILNQAKLTGAISEADWKEVNQRTAECLQEKSGYPTTVVYEGANAYLQQNQGTELPSGDTDRQIERDTIACVDQFSGAVNTVYRYLYGGPMYRDPEFVPRAIYDCLKDKELIPKSVTWEEFEADYWSSTQNPDDKIYGPEAGPGFDTCWRDAQALGEGR